jgi:hypothetical protein
LIRSTRDSAAARGLYAWVESRSTGKLAVGAGAVEVAVHLLHGDVVAATAADDDRQIVRMLQLQGLVDDDRAEQLETASDEGADVFGEILELGVGEALDEVLRERFRQNLCDYLSSVSTPKPFAQKGVIGIANIQMGHDTTALLDEICSDCDEAKTVDVDALVVRGAGEPGDNPIRLAIAELVGAEPRTVSSLLHEVPAEQTRARIVISALLEDGVLAPPGDDPDDLELQADQDVDDLPYEDDETVSTDRSALRAMAEAIPSDLTSTPEGAGRAVDATPEPAPSVETGPVPRSLSEWLDGGKGVDDEELDFFSDHDAESRGGEKDGSFSLDDRSLERFEVAPMGDDGAPDDAPVEVGEAPAVRFGAPVLSEDEAFSKISVANEVLLVVVQAFDEAEGSGKGRSVMQLLVDGAPGQFSLLLHDLDVGDGGQLPDDPLLRNLGKRPATEHRQLLNSTLVDLIDRALSSAADDLPEEQLDEVLNAVAGYRSRLGL